MHRTISPHPAWCDPRLCDTRNSNTVHRSTPMVWQPGCDDIRVTVCLLRNDDYGLDAPSIGQTTASLELFDTASVTPHRDDRECEMSLDAPAARMLAAALVTVAEQLEAVQAVTR